MCIRDRLWEVDLSGHFLGAVTNVFERHRLDRPAELGLAGPGAYFNSGVLLLNLDEMRRAGSTEALARHARERAAELLWPDQDTLNVVLGARRLELAPRWNAMNSLSFPWSDRVYTPALVEEALRKPAIRHFEGPAANKPWHYLRLQPSRELYFEHRRETPWPDVRLEGVTPLNAVRRWRRLRRERQASA